MMRLQRLVTVTAATCAVTFAAMGQTPAPAPEPARPASGAEVNANANANTPAAVAAEHQPVKRRSIVHHYPYPYPEYYHGDQTAGFRNPGGNGRYLEYYPPGNRLQERGDPVKVARFDQGGGAPDRAEQIQAQQVGVQKENAIMNHIDNYARPSYGYGFGAGFFGGYY